MSQKHGSEKVRDMIVDDIRSAQVAQDKEKVLMLFPEATPPNHPWSKLF